PDQSTTGLYPQPPGGGPWPLEFPPGPPGNDCLNLDFEGGKIYVASYDRGIGRYDGTQWKYWFPATTPVNGSAADTTFRRPLFPYALLIDKLGYKWFGC